MSERSSHPSPAQIEALLDFLERHPDLAKGFSKSQHAREKSRRQWEELSVTLNSMGGTIKSSKQWTKYWSDKKSAVKKKVAARAAARRKTGGGLDHDVIELSEVEERIVALFGGERFGTGDSHLGIELFPTPTFKQVMHCCVQLMRAHGLRADMVIDDSAFQQILTLTSLTAEERSKVTAENVRSMMEGADDDHDYCAEIDTSAMDESGEENEFPVPMLIKDEVEVTHWTCSCDAISGHHDESCAAAAVDYLDHYLISADEATCTICDETLTWQSVSTLKKHLQNQHPEVTGIGDHEDESQIQKDPPSTTPSVKLIKDIKLTHIKENPVADTPPANKKRKIEPDDDIDPITTKHAADKEPITKHAADKEPITKYTAENEPITKHNAFTLDRFKSLDQFGLYVASLLKLLPKDKCIKYQNQIVDRLLKDQAAAA